MRRSKRNIPSINSADLCGQISTNSISKFRKPFADDVNDKYNIDNDYNDEESFQETHHIDIKFLKLNDRNVKGQSHIYNNIEEQKFHNLHKNSRTDSTARPASIISSISSMASMAPFKTKFDDSTESSIKKKVTIKNGPVSVQT